LPQKCLVIDSNSEAEKLTLVTSAFTADYFWKARFWLDVDTSTVSLAWNFFSGESFFLEMPENVLSIPCVYPTLDFYLISYLNFDCPIIHWSPDCEYSFCNFDEKQEREGITLVAWDLRLLFTKNAQVIFISTVTLIMTFQSLPVSATLLESLFYRCQWKKIDI